MNHEDWAAMYNQNLLAISFLIAVIASYTVLDVSRRVSLSRGWKRSAWLTGGACAMGIGIWAMHFIAMLAYHPSSLSVTYSVLMVALSVLVAIAASLGGLVVACRPDITMKQLTVGGTLVGFAISGMHYIGMAAMDNVTIRYEPSLFTLSIVIAVGASIAALMLSFRFRVHVSRFGKMLKLGSGVIMGTAITGMHYTGMAAAHIVPVSSEMTHSDAAYQGNYFLLAVLIAAGTIVVLALALFSAYFADQRLAEQIALKGSILESAMDCIVMLDARGNILEFNPVAEETFGYSQREVIGRNMTELIIPPPLRQEYTDRLNQYLKSGDGKLLGNRYETMAMRADGSEFPIELTVTRIKKAGAPILTTYLRDITERRLADETIMQMAYYDPLTELPNRNLFMQMVAQVLQQARQTQQTVSVMFIDLDRFKYINDTLGHYVGDSLLQAVAQLLQRCMRKTDIVSRLGGDEFIALLPNTGRQGAAMLAQRIIDQMKQPMVIDKHHLFITPSIGLTVYPEDAFDVDSLVKNADLAMYASKETGKNVYTFFDPRMNMVNSRKLELEQGLRKALEQQEFDLYYQPKIHIRTRKIIGMEALIRWQHPELGWVSPGEFIPIAEETGLIFSIGEWIMRMACMQNKAWQSQGYPPVRMAVNLSLRQFNQEHFVSGLAQILAETGLDARWLELEITESIAIRNEKYVINRLQAIKELGVSISIDDFGTGYSSLSYLKKFPIDTLKIDRAFVRDIAKSSDDTAIVQAIIAMAHSLKLRVLAEGVETKEQLAFLRRHACDEAQGYLFSRPVPADGMEKLLSRRIPLKGERAAKPSVSVQP
ncbi:bifunctional diguanylate cyclase/phosphodiesterase [Paenibacillus cremeus]|nr:bifunctional diguanylate cyclase/phosphodiesterase [Paenibacillus cremeus]